MRVSRWVETKKRFHPLFHYSAVNRRDLVDEPMLCFAEKKRGRANSRNPGACKAARTQKFGASFCEEWKLGSRRLGSWVPAAQRAVLLLLWALEGRVMDSGR